MTHEAIKEQALMASYTKHWVLFACKRQSCSSSRSNRGECLLAHRDESPRADPIGAGYNNQNQD
jgi:hypothetical protein